MKTWNIIATTALLTLISTAMAQNPLDLVAAPIQEQVNTMGQKAVQHITQGNLTQEHITQDISATKKNLTQQAKEKLNQNLNLTPEQLQQRATQELKNQASQKVQQPGFEVALAILGTLAAACLIQRRN